MKKYNSRFADKFRFTDRLRIPDYDTFDDMRPGQLIFDADKCKECSICVRICPGGCILTETVTKTDILSGKVKGAKQGVPRLETSRYGVPFCIACYCCGTACPHSAISIKTSYNPKFRFKRLSQTSNMQLPRRY